MKKIIILTIILLLLLLSNETFASFGSSAGIGYGRNPFGAPLPNNWNAGTTYNITVRGIVWGTAGTSQLSSTGAISAGTYNLVTIGSVTSGITTLRITNLTSADVGTDLILYAGRESGVGDIVMDFNTADEELDIRGASDVVQFLFYPNVSGSIPVHASFKRDAYLFFNTLSNLASSGGYIYQASADNNLYVAPYLQNDIETLFKKNSQFILSDSTGVDLYTFDPIGLRSYPNTTRVWDLGTASNYLKWGYLQKAIVDTVQFLNGETLDNATNGVIKVGADTLLVSGSQRITGKTTYTPSDTASVIAGSGIKATFVNAKTVICVIGNGGGVTVTATPSITAGSNGQIIIIQGRDDTNTVTLQDESNLPGSTLELSGSQNVVLGKGDILVLIYNSTDSKWYEVSFADN